MNLLARAREESNISIQWAMRQFGITLNRLEYIESLPDNELTYEHFKLYSQVLALPVGALFDGECNLPLKRGSALRAYRTLLLLEKKEDNKEKLNLIAQIKGALHNAIPDMRPDEFPPMLPLKHESACERWGKFIDNPISKEYYHEFDSGSALKII
jgi:hypothetical protein